MKYRKKPVIVDAVQWTGKNADELKTFVDSDVLSICHDYDVYIGTLEGIHHASIGDYIIKGVHGEFYPCKPDIFAETYELAE